MMSRARTVPTVGERNPAAQVVLAAANNSEAAPLSHPADGDCSCPYLYNSDAAAFDRGACNAMEDCPLVPARDCLDVAHDRPGADCIAARCHRPTRAVFTVPSEIKDVPPRTPATSHREAPHNPSR